MLISGSAIAQNCEYIFFSEYVEGSFNNKALELYNPTWQDITLNNDYRLIRWSNGSSTSDADIRYVQPLTGTIPAYGTYVCFLDRRDPNGTGLDTMLFQELMTIANTVNGGFYSPDYNSGTQGSRVLAFNGDDCFSIQKNIGGNWVDLDFIGVKGEQPVNGNGTTSPNGGWTAVPNFWDGQGPYWTKDQTLIRKPGIQAGVMNSGVPYSVPGAFDPSVEWDSLPRNTFDSLGSHTCVCRVTSVNEIDNETKVVMYPNPLRGESFAIESEKGIALVRIYNLSGQIVREERYADLPFEVNLTKNGLTPGVYNVAIELRTGSTVSKRLNIQ